MDPRRGSGSSAGSLAEALRGSGDVGSDLLAVDWDSTPLGQPDTWVAELATALRILLTSRFAMWMAWGPELTFFCNEAYRRDTLGTKYPWALGKPASAVWSEIWSDIGPRIEHVLRTGEATWDESLLLFLERSGYVEETYHTFSYSPLTDATGQIVGMLCVVSEETERVIGERRMATLQALGAASTAGRSGREYLTAAADALATNTHSLPFTLMYLFDEFGGAELVASSGIAPGHEHAPSFVAGDDPEAIWPVAALRRDQRVVVHDLSSFGGSLPTGAWSEPPSLAVALPLRRPVTGEPPYGFLIVGANPYRTVDGDYLAFLDLLASQLSSGLATVAAYETERLRAEQLAELDRAKTAFFANVSHELRTPLTLLLGPAEDALAAPASDVGPAERERMQLIARNGSRLLRLVNSLLEFSRLEDGRESGRFEPVDLAKYTRDLTEMFAPTIARGGLELIIEVESLSQPVYVDREMWAKIVLNLLSNAYKYTLEGSIIVRLAEAQDHVRLSVIDTGIGIELNQQQRLFERFHRVVGSKGRTFEGTGIGLALVAELAALHGGRPEVSSRPGLGSTFSVEIPLGTDHLAPEHLANAPLEISLQREFGSYVQEADRWLPVDHAESQEYSADLLRPRILVVDDNADMRDYVAGLLSAHYLVETAIDGEAALAATREREFDLVLSDVMMPRLDGFGLLAALRSDPRTLALPFVMLSARAGDDGLVEGLGAGADDYLVKPFSARELLARVAANLELDRVRRTRDELQHSRQMQDQAERLAEVGSWEVDLESGRVDGSDHLITMLGLKRAEFEALSRDAVIEKTVHPEDQDALRWALAEAAASGEAFEVEVRLGLEADQRWVLIGGAVEHDGNGHRPRLRGFIQDTTERRLAAAALAAAAAEREAAAREYEIAEGLQRSMLPKAAPEAANLEIGTFYRAGERGMRVGGDWYDAIELGGGRIGLAIGDVTGRGIAAASLMGQLRAAVRAYASLDLPPGDLLEMLDRLTAELGEGRLVTFIYGVYDRAQNEFSYANAGHLPPLLKGGNNGEVQRLPNAVSPPLGLGLGRFAEERVPFAPGATLVFYTDGLVERRGQDLSESVNVLAQAVASGPVSVTDLPASLAETLAPDGGLDDIAIIAAHAGAERPYRVAATDLRDDPSSASFGRRFVAKTLRGWAVDEDIVTDACLIASELMTNAIVHAMPPFRLRLRATERELMIEVDDGASALPHKMRPSDLSDHGRGLMIVSALAKRWAARPRPEGKTVWGALQLPATERRQSTVTADD